MAPIKSPEHALLVVSILGQELSYVSQAVTQFEKDYGLAYISEPLAFSWTDYYQGELGSQPARRFVALQRLDDPSILPEIKRKTSRMEVAFSRPGNPRLVNIDPGFLNAHQLVVASTKQRSHRIYLGRGIYGDLMLLYQKGTFCALPWTYPDYAELSLRNRFNQLRTLYLTMRRLRVR